MRPRHLALVGALSVSCNAILGLDETEVVDSFGDDGGGATTGGKPGAGGKATSGGGGGGSGATGGAAQGGAGGGDDAGAGGAIDAGAGGEDANGGSNAGGSDAGSGGTNSGGSESGGAGGANAGGANTGGAGGGCSGGLVLCDETCTNLATDEANCGACGTACDRGQICSKNGSLPPLCTGPSCESLTLPCGKSDSWDRDDNGQDEETQLPESCCTRRFVSGAAFKYGCAVDDGTGCDARDELAQRQDGVRIHSFDMDAYEVTVGRFRAFVADYDRWHETDGNPKPGDGAHYADPDVSWKSEFDAALPASAADMESAIRAGCTLSTGALTYPASAGDAVKPNLPMNCADWYVAEAFCIWDGGRLPLEVEWEYAAKGGAEDRAFPWGELYPRSPNAPLDISAPWPGQLLPEDLGYSPDLEYGNVGLHPRGRSYFKIHDLVGSAEEYTFDATGGASYPLPDCAALWPKPCARVPVGAEGRMTRGISYRVKWFKTDGLTPNLAPRASNRTLRLPSVHDSAMGFRCVYQH